MDQVRNKVAGQGPMPLHQYEVTCLACTPRAEKLAPSITRSRSQLLYRDWQKDHRYRVFILIKNYTCFASEIAQNSSQYAPALFFD
jgi:hypothetical protein